MAHALPRHLILHPLRKLRMAGLLLMAAVLGGCVPVPFFPFANQQITEETLASIKPETSTRIDVLLALSDPSTRGDQDRYFIYSWQQVHGGLIFVVGGMGGVLPVAAVGADSCNSVVIRFADDGKVAAVKQFKSEAKASGATLLSEGNSNFMSGVCGNAEMANEIDAWLKEVTP
jgi:hypothetical protein